MCSDLYLLDSFSLPFSLFLLSFVRLFVLFAFLFFLPPPMSVAPVLQ